MSRPRCCDCTCCYAAKVLGVCGACSINESCENCGVDGPFELPERTHEGWEILARDLAHLDAAQYRQVAEWMIDHGWTEPLESVDNP